MNFKIYGIIITIISIASLIKCKCIIKNETSVTTIGSEVIPIGVGSWIDTAVGVLEQKVYIDEIINLFGATSRADIVTGNTLSWGEMCWLLGPFKNQCKVGFECSFDWWRQSGWCR
jgi:hypothetical protein